MHIPVYCCWGLPTSDGASYVWGWIGTVAKKRESEHIHSFASGDMLLRSTVCIVYSPEAKLLLHTEFPYLQYIGSTLYTVRILPMFSVWFCMHSDAFQRWLFQAKVELDTCILLLVQIGPGQGFQLIDTIAMGSSLICILLTSLSKEFTVFTCFSNRWACKEPYLVRCVRYVLCRVLLRIE